MKTFWKEKKRIISFVLIAALLVSVVPNAVRAYNLHDGWYDDPRTVATWGENSEAMQWIVQYDDEDQYHPTGLAFNCVIYPTNPNILSGEAQQQALSIAGWPLGAQTFLAPRSGYSHDGFDEFVGRHLFCTANHQNAISIHPGTQAFVSGKYELDGNFFPAANQGADPGFNFLMLAIACYYPGDYSLVEWATYQEQDPYLAHSLVGQTIAWLATDKDAGFSGNWDTDYNFYKNSNYYKLMDSAFPQNLAPEIHNILHTAPSPESGAGKAGMQTMKDAWFWDIWHAAFLTNKLNANWDKMLSSFHTAIEEADGEYHAYIDLFTSEEAKIYLDGITFSPYGDWEYLGLEADGRQHFKSPSGEVDENGSIGYLYWPEDRIGYLMPIDKTKATLYTFDTYNKNANPPAFGRTQTQFSSYIEKGLQIHVTTEDNPIPHESGPVERFEHDETWKSNYNVNLYKFDSETGKPLEGSRWDILEKFDDSQLNSTDLDREPDFPGEYNSGLGSLNSTEWGDDEISSNYNGDMGVTQSDTNRYNWGNDNGTQFERWTDPLYDVCERDENVTGADGKLYEIDSSGRNSGDSAHTDTYSYNYHKGYCMGHPAPEIEYIECDHEEDEECDCEELNQEIHDEAWEKWYQEVVTCEKLVEQGGFFHCIEPGDAAQKAMEEDRDQFYKDFISLTYEYSARELTPAKGYILHGTHTDDIPIEWRIVTSSEYKDTEEATNLEHNGAASVADNKEEPETNKTGVMSVETEKPNENIHEEREEIVPDSTPSEAEETFFVSSSKQSSSTAKWAETEEEEFADLDIFDDGTVRYADGDRPATDSVATESETRPKTEKNHTGFLASVKNAWDEFTDWLTPKPAADDEEDGDSGSGGGNLRNSLSFLSSMANTIKAAASDIIDWTFIVYDHRTEGEIHFNKRDLDLNDTKTDQMDDYGQENGDGTLEGAVYGLFATQDIIHPDTSGGTSESDEDTGIVFKKGDLVAVTTTDRNGDGSFLTITEAPGSVYNYETGKIEHTEWFDDAPKNLHISEPDSAAKEDDVESFIGHNPDASEITAGNGVDLTDTSPGDDTHTDEFFYKHSSNQEYEDTYREEDTTGCYPISNNEANNGNCWIGRPLLIPADGTTYVIKELSRSEGYELSVFGKTDELVTNRKAFEDGEITESNGNVEATKITEDTVNGGFTYTVMSSETDHGYLVTLTNIPEGATVNMTTITKVWDDTVSHPEEVVTYVPVTAKKGELVTLGGKNWKAQVGDRIEFNGKTFTVNNVKTITHDKQKVKPDNDEQILNPYLDVTTITPSGNVVKDINLMLNQLGYRKTMKGSPWLALEVDAFDVESVAKAINEDIFTNDWYRVFNAMQVTDSYYKNGHAYVVLSYCYQKIGINHALYNEANDTIYVKTDADYEGLSADTQGYIYRTYRAADCSDVERNESGFVTSAIVPNQVTEGSAQYHSGNPYDTITFKTRPNATYWAYADGEQLLDREGNPVMKEEKKIVDVTPTLVTKVENTPIEVESYTETGKSDAGFSYGTYTYAVSQEYLDSLENGEISFRVTFDGTNQEVSTKTMWSQQNGHVSVTLPLITSGSYIESVILTYPGPDQVRQDGNTIAKPTRVQERPIRQKIKVSKDIQTLPEPKVVWYCKNCGYENADGTGACGYCQTARTTEETKTIRYAHDTYSAVHSENLDADGSDGGLLDWLTQLLNGGVKDQSAKDVPEFRFKAYLKSNLERLYRNPDGEIIWMDRNGNVMTPQYEDTNGDGNYDTFTWKYVDAYEGKTVDWPEKDKVSDDGSLQSSNVQKIYTKIKHNSDADTTSHRANSVWSTYLTPGREDTKEVAEKTGYSTSERVDSNGENGEASGLAVYGSDSLYSYSGTNEDVAKSDRLNDKPNTEYVRILETTLKTMEDGAGTTREVETYNYEKFFDAIHAANVDIWDDDMHSTFTGDSMKNYPGQHWFETFYEKYQRDDADPDHTLENTDGVDQDNTAGGDRDTSFKPFRWIRENVFGDRTDYEKDPAEHNGANTETSMSTSDFARANAEASDAVRQFATKWYLEQEAAKLMKDNGVGENIAKAEDGTLQYDEAVYDEALFNAIAKAYNYLKPFYVYDLDTVYSVEWDSAADGGTDKDYTTLSIDLDDNAKTYNVSSYLPYGVYVIVEQQPMRRDDSVNDWDNRSYTIEKPKEVILPSLYDGAESNDTTDNYDPHYSYDPAQTSEDQAKEDNYLIRFGEEWSDDAPNTGQDERQYVIRAHGYDGDFEVYKYGLDVDLLNPAQIRYGGGLSDGFAYAGWNQVQEDFDPLKDTYNTAHRGKDGAETTPPENGGNDGAGYDGAEKTNGADTANGSNYNGTAVKNRYFYGSVSEDKGSADKVMFKGGATDDNNVSGMQWKDDVISMTGELTAYDGKYAPMLVPWTVTAPADIHAYDSENFSGYADVNERDGFYTTFLRVNKTDSETGEYILHDDAIFGLYAGSRYQSFEEIEKDSKLIKDAEEREKFLNQFKPGDAKFYLQDTQISGTREFLMGMGAKDITPVNKSSDIPAAGVAVKELCTGIVPKGTPVCVESEQIMLTNQLGNRTGQMTVYTTNNDVKVAGEENAADKTYQNQNTGYFVTPQPVGAGVYVLAELKAPNGYARSKPVAYEVYSDKTQYYVDGDMYQKVTAVRYTGNQMEDVDYEN